MGRKPDQAATDKDGFLGVGSKEMLTALENMMQAVKEGDMAATEYSFTFTTATVNRNAGCLGSLKGHLSSWKYLKKMVRKVEKIFEAVDSGYKTEDCYYFELTTPYFQFTSGHYPPQDEYWKKPVLWINLKIYGRKYCLSIGITFQFWHVWLATIALIMLTSPAGTLAMTNHEKTLTLTAGKNGIVPFECSNQQQFAPKFTTVKFEEKERPFYIDGILDPEGLMSPDQAERFTVEYYEDSSLMSIEISITSVSVEDQGTYIVMVIVQGTTQEVHLMKKAVIIIIPPGPAQCFFKRSESLQIYNQLDCKSKPGNGNFTLSCFQNGDKIPYLNNDNDPNNQIVKRRVFWITDLNIPVSCCSHDVKDMSSITQDSCNQYRYPRIEPITSPVPPANNIPTEKHVYSPTKPSLGMLPTEEENGQSVSKSASHSGCTQNFVWPPLLLPAIIITYACTMIP